MLALILHDSYYFPTASIPGDEAMVKAPLLPDLDIPRIPVTIDLMISISQE